MYTLLLRLGAPLQSWGSDSVYDKRETDYFPTKSGVIGMLASALGRRRDEPVDDLTELEFGIRIDSQGIRIHDFQITEMGDRLNANLSDRVYLGDAVFLAGLSSEDRQMIEKLEFAVNHPVFPLFLGRRSCPPTQPLVLGIVEKPLYPALKEHEWLVPEWRQNREFGYADKKYLRIITDGDSSGAVKKDVPYSFSPYKREYGYRYITEQTPKIVYKNKERGETEQRFAGVPEHDPMSELR